MEISLESTEPCNLMEYHLPIAHRLGIRHEDVLPFMVHYTKRVTFSNYDWEQSRDVIYRNRRLGVSLSGFMDWVLLRFGTGAITGWKKYAKDEWNDMVWLDGGASYELFDKQPSYDPSSEVIEPVYNEALLEEIDRMYRIAKQADGDYSAILTKSLGYEVVPSVKITTVKPSGTVSLLSGISPGVHAHYFRYGIRRIRVQSNDPLLKLCETAGYTIEEAKQNPGSHVIEFPFKAPTADFEDFRSISDITIEEQFAMQSLLCVYWADNMVSCTITFHEHEQQLIQNLLTQYRMRIKSTSLLPYSGHGYVQAPYEPKDKEWFEAAMKKIQWKPQELYHVLMGNGEFEDQQMDLADALECLGGSCPVK